MNTNLAPELVVSQLENLLNGPWDDMDIVPLVESLGRSAERFEPLIIHRLCKFLSVPFVLPDE
jgi:hypothetical protein